MYIDLKILIVEPDFKKRSALKGALSQVGQPNVQQQNDARELFNISKSANFDLIFVSLEPGYGLYGPDLIRYLTRTSLVTPWCKFILTSNDAEFQLSSPIFRHLQTQILHLPIDFNNLKSLIRTSSTSIKVLKPLLSQLHKVSPKELVQQVNKVKLKAKNTVVDDELLSLKLKLLIQARRPDLALRLSPTLNSMACRMRENLYISYTTGQKQDFDLCLEEAQQTGRFQAGSIYFKCNHLIAERKYSEALEHFSKLKSVDMQHNEIEVLCLLKQKSLGVRHAFEFIDTQIANCDKKSMSYHSLVLTKLKLCSIAMLTEEFEYFDPMELYLEMQDLSENKSWTKESFKYQNYKPFVELGVLIIEDNSLAVGLFETLLQRLQVLDHSQLNILLFAANCLNRDEDSLRIHEQLDKLIARIEVSPELLSFRISHWVILESTMEPERIKYRLEYLALNHWQAGRYYRALEKFREIVINFDTTSEFKSQYRRLIKDSGIASYWGFDAH